MKQGITILTVLFVLMVSSCTTGNQEDNGTFVSDADYVQVVLFHLAQRCESCNAVEEETLLLLETEYEDELKAGKVKFISLNFQSRKGKEAASLLRASGQTLFVVRGDSINNLTGPAFMYASTHPENYREALSKALDQALE